MTVTPLLTMRLGRTDRKKLSLIARRLGTNRTEAMRLLIRAGHKELAGIKAVTIPLNLRDKLNKEKR